MNFERRVDVTEPEYIEMIRLKTSVLLACAAKAGAILGGASDEEASLLYAYAEQVGLAFQLQDDWLDVYLPCSERKSEATSFATKRLTC